MSLFKSSKTSESPFAASTLSAATATTSRKLSPVVPVGPPLGQTGGKLTQKEAIVRVLLRSGNGVPLPSTVI